MYPVARTMRSTPSSVPSLSCTRAAPAPSVEAATTEVPGRRRNRFPCSLGVSHHSRVRRPTSQNLRAIASCSEAGSERHQPGEATSPLDVLVGEAPAHPLEPRHLVAVHDVHLLGPVLADEGSPLIGALSAADDQDPGAGEIVEAHQVACVRAQAIRQAGAPVRQVLEVPHPGGGDDRVGDELLSPSSRRTWKR